MLQLQTTNRRDSRPHQSVPFQLGPPGASAAVSKSLTGGAGLIIPSSQRRENAGRRNRMATYITPLRLMTDRRPDELSKSPPADVASAVQLDVPFCLNTSPEQVVSIGCPLEARQMGNVA